MPESEPQEIIERVEELEHLVYELRVARSVHDSLGQTACEINLQLDLIEAFKADDPERADNALREAKRLSIRLLEDIRLAFSKSNKHI